MSELSGPTAASAHAPPRARWLPFLERYGAVIFLLLLVAFFGFQNERFLSVRNLTNILTEVSIYGIVAVGMTYVILTGGVDLAVGSLLAFAAMTSAWVLQRLGADFAMSWLLALCLSTAVGAAVGWIHGKSITLLGVPPFIVTLGGMTVWRGGTLILNDGAPISGFSESYRWWGVGDVLGVPAPVLVFIVVAGAGYVVQRYTRYGRRIYAVGGNPEAARLCGVDVKGVLTSVYVLVGLLSGLAGFLLSARLGSAEAVAGTGYELRVIASVVIGGASLFGGLGGVGGTIVGALLIGVLTNGLVMMQVSSYWQQVVIGAVIVLAVAVDTLAKSRGR
jgi:inositol transport system permease protein